MKTWQVLGASLTAVLLVAGLAAVVVLSREPETPSPTRPLADIPMATLVGVTVRGSGGDACRVERRELNDWYVVVPVSQLADQDHVVWLLEDLLGVEASSGVPAVQIDLARAGLAAPAATITLSLHGGEERSLQVGAFEPQVQGYYVGLGDLVYLFPWDVISRALRWLQGPPIPVEPTPGPAAQGPVGLTPSAGVW